MARCEGACATSDCYLLADILEEKTDNDDSYKLVNTGTLTKYGTLWGKKPITYLKRKILHPIVKKHDFENLFLNKSYDVKTKSPKIIIKGLTKLDAMFDGRGEYIPGKSTVVVFSENIRMLKILLALINSSFAIAYLLRRFPSATYNGGLTFNGDIIGAIPVPELTQMQENFILDSVDQILLLGPGINEERITKLDNYISLIYGWSKELT